ncbi:MAG: hypothetical protein A2V86_00575 [Deltaproteobacteria bacterium RBG_16_49_23]|nr:MAG: hypothetical protein A2V86_00575 [Deltaproteobacteria bacterium RBG_16_49_23]
MSRKIDHMIPLSYFCQRGIKRNFKIILEKSLLSPFFVSKFQIERTVDKTFVSVYEKAGLLHC